MFYTWWYVLIIPALMVLLGLILPRIKMRKYRSPKRQLTAEQQKYADGVFCKLLWQFGLVYGALGFMIMRSIRLTAAGTQNIVVYVIVALQVIGAISMVIPVEGAIDNFESSKESEQ